MVLHRPVETAPFYGNLPKNRNDLKRVNECFGLLTPIEIKNSPVNAGFSKLAGLFVSAAVNVSRDQINLDSCFGIIAVVVRLRTQTNNKSPQWSILLSHG